MKFLPYFSHSGNPQELALVNAALAGNLAEVQRYIELGLSPNAIGITYPSALHAAAKSGSVEVIDYLVSRDADVNLKDRQGETPLHCAAEYLQLEAVQRLVDSGAEVDVEDKLGKTPLTSSFSRYDPEFYPEEARLAVAKLLIEKGARVDRDDVLPSALSYPDCADLVRLLLNAGAEPKNDSVEKTLLKMGYPTYVPKEAIDLLREHVAPESDSIEAEVALDRDAADMQVEEAGGTDTLPEGPESSA